jgi:hypothetical protein
LFDCEDLVEPDLGPEKLRVGVPVQRAPCAAVSAKFLGPRQGRFGFGHETVHDLGHPQDFLDCARRLPG